MGLSGGPFLRGAVRFPPGEGLRHASFRRYVWNILYYERCLGDLKVVFGKKGTTVNEILIHIEKEKHPREDVGPNISANYLLSIHYPPTSRDVIPR